MTDDTTKEKPIDLRIPRLDQSLNNERTISSRLQDMLEIEAQKKSRIDALTAGINRFAEEANKSAGLASAISSQNMHRVLADANAQRKNILDSTDLISKVHKKQQELLGKNDAYEEIARQTESFRKSINARQAYSPHALEDLNIHSGAQPLTENPINTTNKHMTELVDLQSKLIEANRKSHYKSMTVNYVVTGVVIFTLLLTGLIAYGSNTDNQRWQREQKEQLEINNSVLMEIRDNLQTR